MTMPDEVRLWSDELARDPSSLVFLPLAEALRRQGQLDLALKVASRGLERHPHNPDAHDQLARIHADRGDLQAAFDEWDMVLRLVPRHVGATKGMAFVLYQQGRLAESEQLLVRAQSEDDDAALAAALRRVRRSGDRGRLSGPAEMPDDPRELFADALSPDQSAILLDKEGLVVAGSYYGAEGRDVAGDVGATLSGISGEATRAMRHLQMGAWRSIVFEAEAAVVTLAPAPPESAAAGGVVVLAASPNTPLGSLKRPMERCLARARAFVHGGP
jgi:tetratricopeptide (TPR) repeat protein